MCFFFFKQKTAYEMRISDWSSDVCSSDLGSLPLCRKTTGTPAAPKAAPLGICGKIFRRKVPQRLMVSGAGSGAAIAFLPAKASPRAMRGATRFGLGNRATLLFNPDSIRGPAFRRCRAEPPTESEVTMQPESGAVSNLAAAMLARHARQCHIEGTAAGRRDRKSVG